MQQLIARFKSEKMKTARKFIYLGFIATIPFKYTEGALLPYPGIPLRLGAESEVVRILQEYLNDIAAFFPLLPTVNPTGYFGPQTEAAVIAFQNFRGITPNGTVGAATWNEITSLLEDLYSGNRLNEGQFPGYEIGR